jgi:hypothetical protein
MADTKYSSGYEGLDDYLKTSYEQSILPAYDFLKDNVYTPAINFMQSGSSYNTDESALQNFTSSFKDIPAGPVPDIFKPPVYGPENNPNPVVTTPIDWASADPWHDMGSPTGLDPTDTADDRFRREAAANLKRNTGNTTSNDPTGKLSVTFGGGGGGGSPASAPSAPFSLSQDLSQRPLSGTQYAPDLSAYNDSSLFNYTGPGGLSEYTYGQGLPYQGAGYDIWGTPTDMVNPYYTGQFAPESTGVADGAISLPPVDMPAGVAPTNNNPNVGTSNANIVPQGTGPGGKDLTYQETLDYFNLNPYAQSTTFPSPAGANPSLFDRQLAEMSPEQIARMNQILADETRMQQGQLGSGFKDEEKLNKDVQKVILDNEPLDQVIYDYNRENPTPENFWSTRTQEERDALDARALNAITAEDLRDGLFGDPQYSIANDAFTLNMLPQKNNANVGDDGNLINRTPPERSIWKDDEINIPTPLKPAGVEGEDYWQSTQGGYYSTDDDLGLEPLVMSGPFSAEETQKKAEAEQKRYALTDGKINAGWESEQISNNLRQQTIDNNPFIAEIVDQGLLSMDEVPLHQPTPFAISSDGMTKPMPDELINIFSDVIQSGPRKVTDHEKFMQRIGGRYGL